MRWGRGPCNEGELGLWGPARSAWSPLGGQLQSSPPPPHSDTELAGAPRSDLITQMLRFRGQDLGAP